MTVTFNNRMISLILVGACLIPGIVDAAGCRASFSEMGYSRLCWLFDEGKGKTTWHVSGNSPGGGPYLGDDYYANNWNYGSGRDDLGLNVKSGSAGTVIYAQDTGEGYGKQVIIQARENTNFAIRYTHLDEIRVATGDAVDVGTLIGTVGDSGLPPNRCNAAGGWRCPQLHLVVYKNINEISRYNRTALSWLKKGRSPLRVVGDRPTKFAAKFRVADP
ncbi:M23 family metallopeptidase [Candidatus Thiosymbion oneisti]|uniref:M23 family metallopeptidase n=1 Tax=Candidatus Thiosymbion oneisti TaxID=589554 RepID=UPI00105B851E|nr:M23 family metallopeptidase [Candidatus Thiosymbion oneisti]